MNKPMKCKCGKMISRPKANKSGLCCSCSIRKTEISRRKSPCIKSTSCEHGMKVCDEVFKTIATPIVHITNKSQQNINTPNKNRGGGSLRLTSSADNSLNLNKVNNNE